ncbi:MAG: antibiotic biosynthesis monooxygenase [Kineosporiaceae bacterium]|nr:antibiotic biosynthesis monooxygenase [Kineosporiaceae bacterium]MBK7622361.1 antibiotic biosynthesis monooxygenase [Kineosporiaceae bacterium]MBK8074689.1 antibiotic biosynthesis monooxygenase [Kineosporiaceae bacterium]
MQLTASFHARPGHENLVRDLLAAYALVVRASDGTILFEPSTVAGHAQTFVVFERYRDAAAFEAHLAAAENKTFNADLAEHIVGEVQLQFLDPLPL